MYVNITREKISIKSYDKSNDSDAVKNYTSSLENVRLVCRQRFPLQLGVVLVLVFFYYINEPAKFNNFP